MSYLDPQSWTDVDSAGNPLDWTSRNQKLLYPGYEMLRRAIVERSLGAITGGPLARQRGQGTIYSTPGYGATWHNYFQNYMTSLLTGPPYVNHTDHGGDWHGQVPAAPYWTEADILVAIGDPVRIPRPDRPDADWAIQQYKLLNMLRWTKIAVGGGYMWRDRQRRIGSAGDATYPYSTWAEQWTEVTDEWDDGWYSVYNDTPITVRGARAWGYRSYYWDWLKFSNAESHRGKLAVTVQGPGTGLQCNIDWYLYFSMGQGWGATGVQVFDPVAVFLDRYGGGLQKMSKLFSTGPHTGGDYYETGWVCEVSPGAPIDPGGTPPSETDYNLTPGGYMRGYWAGGPTAVLKWDYTGGFKFRDF